VIRKLEKYELLDEIGHGGMATVFRARDERLDRLVAVKVLHPHLQKAREARVRFTREAKSVAKLKHPNILEIYDYSGEGSEESYIAAELLTGPTLKRFVEDQGELPAEVAACFTIQIARALGAAHAEGIVHRDVKPENVLLHENRILKLTDFGIAQMVDSQSFTATGQILGSPGHMAPEQVEGGDVSDRTDVFSLGTVLYYLAVGRLPFTGRNPHQVLKRIMDGEYPDPLRVMPSIGHELAAIIDKAMRVDPAERYATAKELIDALRAFLAGVDAGECDELIPRYLADREAVSAELREATIAALTRRGRELSSTDRATAVALFNRVLALDESNVEVLQLIERLGRRDRRPMILGGAVAAVLVAGGVAIALNQPPPVPADDLDAGVLTAEDAGSEDAPSDSGAAEPDAGEAPRDAGPLLEVRPAKNTVRVARLPTTRVVVFDPRPASVDIQVDDMPARSFGPGFNRIELAAGTHRIRVTNDACCVPFDRTLEIPRGEDPYPLHIRLRYKPAQFYVRANAAGDVEVRGRARHRTNDFFTVPLEEPVERLSFSVTSDGYRDYTGTTSFRAGQVNEVRVTLERVPEPP